jgi:primosomal protein N' (replication factor Y)
MVTKGHDFPNVTLVGVLDADGALGLPDFRAAERSYQLISQVSGRAGRAAQKGEVYLQTYRPDDELLQAARFHDFGRFAAHEMSLRRAVGYPPLSFMATLRLEGEEGELLSVALTEVSKALTLVPLGVSAQGPNLAPIEQVRGRRRWMAVLRSTQRSSLHEALERIMTTLSKARWSRTLRLIVDVDPLDFL